MSVVERITVAVALVLVAVGLTGCGQSDGSDDATASGQETSTSAEEGDADGSSETDGGTESGGEGAEADAAASAEVATLMLPDDVDEWVERVLVPAEAFPAGLSMADSAQSAAEDDCLGQRSVVVEHPPLAFAAAEITGTHVLGQLVARYESAADAAAAFTYFESLEQLCNEQWLNDADDDFSSIFIEPLLPAPVEGAERLTASIRELHTAEVVVAADTYGAQVGDALLLAIGTDPEASRALLTGLVQRAQGLDVAGPIEVSGTMDLGPGFSSTEYWSWSEGPTFIRQSLSTDVAVRSLGAEAVAWIENASDDRLDEVASAGCVVVHDYDGSTSLDAAVVGAFTPDEIAGTSPQAVGEVFGFLVGIYCPSMADTLTSLATGG